MSGLPTHAQEKPSADGKIIADFDQLFSDNGISVTGDGSHLVLLTADLHGNSKKPAAAPKKNPKVIPRARFEGGEHTAIGDDILLGINAPHDKLAKDVHLHLPNELALTYGQILALGGDFYGIPDRPISEGGSAADRLQRFTDAYGSLAVLPASRAEATKILAVMKKEIDAVNQAIADGKEPHEAYDALGDTLSEDWNRITGGGSIVSALFPLGRYLKLAANNADHFGQWAQLAYIAGHTVALQQAAAANVSQDRKRLEQAYAMNAFADHFLTDLFSSGHLRVPRKELAAVVTPSDLGSLITRFMHDEDSKFGLNVRNGNNEHWRAYGDKRYFDSGDSTNRVHVKQAVQDSADEIYAAFLSGTVPSPTAYAALKRLPDLQAVLNLADNFSPLFRVDGKKVLRRKDVNNLNDTATVDDWWGWSTYLLLKNYNPKGNV
jgi:hypothetical protein